MIASDCGRGRCGRARRHWHGCSGCWSGHGTSEDTTAIREVGLEAVKAADKDTLCAMAVHAAVQDGADVNTRAEAEQAEQAAGNVPRENWPWVADREALEDTIRRCWRRGQR
jgi:hypothetical protein